MSYPAIGVVCAGTHPYKERCAVALTGTMSANVYPRGVGGGGVMKVTDGGVAGGEGEHVRVRMCRHKNLVIGLLPPVERSALIIYTQKKNWNG